MRKVIKIGLIGVGKMGQNHLRVLSMLKSVEVVFIHDVNAKSADKLAALYGVKAVINPLNNLNSVDAVIIASPTVTHADYVKVVAEGGVKNIFVEKPLAATLSDAESLGKLACAMGLNLQTGFIERFNPAVQAMKRVISRANRIISIDFVRTNKLSSRITDVDVITDLMIHDIDLAMYLNGPVESVEAHGVGSGDMVDFASAMLVHAEGRFSRVQASRITDKRMRLIQATCDNMFIDCDLLRKELIVSRESVVIQGDGDPYKISGIKESVEVPPQEALLSELQAFIESCYGVFGDDFPDAKAGLNAMQVCDQIQKAILRA